MQNHAKSIIKEKITRSVISVTALFTILITFIILVVLGKELIAFFKIVSFSEFLFGLKWEPLLEPKSFGILPLISGTFLITFISGIIAIPLGLLSAIYLSEFCPPKIKSYLKPTLEILAGIPTIVYGYFALTFITPLLKIIFPQIEVFNALSGAIVVAIMITPMISSLCDDAFTAVPKSIREGAYAMGATSFEVIYHIMIPYSFSRIVASFILALSRAIGETMAVTLASGANPQLTLNPLDSIQTMTSYIVQISLGDTPAGGVEYLTCYAVAGMLFLMTLLMNLAGQVILAKFSVKK